MLRCLTLAAALCFTAGALNAEETPSLKTGMDSMFVALQKDFNRIAANAAVRKRAAGPVNRLFLRSLKRRVPYHSLLRTNPKGVVVNEVIRMVEKPSTKRQNLSREEWFRRVSSTQESFSDCALNSESGRYHLFWAVPILLKGRKGKQIFLGAVAVRIDLWDCFHLFARNIDTPFLVRMNKRNLYSNKWNDGTSPFGEDPLAVPGVPMISVRYPKPGGAQPQPVLTPVEKKLVKAAEDSIRAAQAKPVKSRKGVFILIVVLLIAAAVAVYRYISTREYKARMKEFYLPEDKPGERPPEERPGEQQDPFLK